MSARRRSLVHRHRARASRTQSSARQQRQRRRGAQDPGPGESRSLDRLVRHQANLGQQENSRREEIFDPLPTLPGSIFSLQIFESKLHQFFGNAAQNPHQTITTIICTRAVFRSLIISELILNGLDKGSPSRQHLSARQKVLNLKIGLES